MSLSEVAGNIQQESPEAAGPSRERGRHYYRGRTRTNELGDRRKSCQNQSRPGDQAARGRNRIIDHRGSEPFAFALPEYNPALPAMRAHAEARVENRSDATSGAAQRQ